MAADGSASVRTRCDGDTRSREHGIDEDAVAVDLDERGRVAEPRDAKSAGRWRGEVGRRARDDGQRSGRNPLFLAAELAPQRSQHRAGEHLVVGTGF